MRSMMSFGLIANSSSGPKPQPSSSRTTLGLSCTPAPTSENTGFFYAGLHAPGIPDCTMTIGTRHERLGDTLLAELARGGRHPLYAPALDAVTPLLPG